MALSEANRRRARSAHIIGSGLAGLAAAVSLSTRGWKVILSEAGPAAGGRCRSYFDRPLGCRIDNGNHLLLSGNSAAISYLATIGACATLTGPSRAAFPFIDLATRERWILAPGRGRLPFWVFSSRRRVPGTRARDYLGLRRCLRAPPEATVAEVLPDGPLYRRLVAPLAIAALNTPPERGSARLFGRVLAQSLARGGAACKPLFPQLGLSETFIDPALAWLATRRATIEFGRRIAALEFGAGHVVALTTADGARIALEAEEAVVVAVPPPVAADLVPSIAVPTDFEAILNVHYRTHASPGPTGFMALIGGLAEWVFVKREVVSVTVSAAARVIERPAGELANEIWPEVCQALHLAGEIPPWRVVKEKRATIAATPEQERKRPPAETRFANLVLAGDWTSTGLPGTIEGAIRSGYRAADTLCR